jgi:uncharacterized protein YdiU (UPF0061 family)
MDDAAPTIVSFSNSYAGLPDHFFARRKPTPVSAPRLVKLNGALAAELGFDFGALANDEIAAIFAGNLLPGGAEPLAMAYAGHQFGSFVPQLGDGRAVLLGEVVDRGGVRRDIQLKGSGPTPFSRRGDGRAALGPVLREYLVSEAMHALGIPATRALAAVTTGDPVYRETELPGAILTRVAASHIRVGTFQYFAARGDTAGVTRLADYVIGRLYPDLVGVETPYLRLLEAFSVRQASLIARWLAVGFIHGVMNTDNMALSGETIDFGPCAFMDVYDPATVFSSIDHHGRYAYANQARIGQWNLARFAETLLPLLDPDETRAIEIANGVVTAFPVVFQGFWLDGMRAKLGLANAEEEDGTLAQGLLDAMQSARADYTTTFLLLGEAAAGAASLPEAFVAWEARWRTRLARDPTPPAVRIQKMRRVNPAVIPRNHRVEAALEAAVSRRDFAPFEELLAVLSSPYDLPARYAAYADAPAPSERPYQTFCGT